MADEGAHVRKHMTAARDHMSRQVQRREQLQAEITAAQAERAKPAAPPPPPPPREAGR